MGAYHFLFMFLCTNGIQMVQNVGYNVDVRSLLYHVVSSTMVCWYSYKAVDVATTFGSRTVI